MLLYITYARSIIDGTFCITPKIFSSLISNILYNLFSSEIETQIFWCKNINEPLIKSLDQRGLFQIVVFGFYFCREKIKDKNDFINHGKTKKNITLNGQLTQTIFLPYLEKLNFRSLI